MPTQLKALAYHEACSADVIGSSNMPALLPPEITQTIPASLKLTNCYKLNQVTVQPGLVMDLAAILIRSTLEVEPLLPLSMTQIDDERWTRLSFKTMMLM